MAYYANQGLSGGTGKAGFSTGYTGFGDMSLSGSGAARADAYSWAGSQSSARGISVSSTGIGTAPVDTGTQGKSGTGGGLMQIITQIGYKAMAIGSAAQNYKDTLKYSKELTQQGLDLLSEARRDADLTRQSANQFAAKQKVDYLSSGVDIGGSPALVIQQTKKYGEAEATNIVRRGENIASQYRAEAERAKKSAKYNLIKSVF